MLAPAAAAPIRRDEMTARWNLISDHLEVYCNLSQFYLCVNNPFELEHREVFPQEFPDSVS